MRKRTRTWPQTVRAYDLQHVEIPEALWAIAKQQRDLWNQLCQLGALTAGCAQADPPAKRLYWWAFEWASRELVKRSGLDWENGPDVLDRYKTAMKDIGKNGKGPPRLHYGLDRVRIIHRYTGGGLPGVGLFGAKSRRCRISPHEEHGEAQQFRHDRWQCFFGVGNATARGMIHESRRRELFPPDSIVKRVALTGRMVRPFGWKWQLQVTVEYPGEVTQRRTLPSCGLDLGWRKIDDTYLRIGVIVDSEGRTFELRLPLDMANRDRRRAGQWSKWEDVERYQQLRDLALEECKAKLREAGLPIAPERLRLMRNHGLLRLRAVLDWPSALDMPAQAEAMRLLGSQGKSGQGASDEPMQVQPPARSSDNPTKGNHQVGGSLDQPAKVELPDHRSSLDDQCKAGSRAALDSWRDEDAKYSRRQTALREWLIRSRRYRYRVLAKWIAETYGTVAMETDMRLDDLQRAIDDDPEGVKVARRQRTWAAVGELRMYIQQACAKTGTVVTGRTAGTTIECSVCGEVTAINGAITAVCPQGHGWDIDANAGRNLLAQIQSVGESDGSMNESVGIPAEVPHPEQPSIFPAQISAVAVMCSLE